MVDPPAYTEKTGRETVEDFVWKKRRAEKLTKGPTEGRDKVTERRTVVWLTDPRDHLMSPIVWQKEKTQQNLSSFPPSPHFTFHFLFSASTQSPASSPSPSLSLIITEEMEALKTPYHLSQGINATWPTVTWIKEHMYQKLFWSDQSKYNPEPVALNDMNDMATCPGRLLCWGCTTA